MTERVFWCETIAVGEQMLDDSESRHARTSLRLNAGDHLTLLDGRGGLGYAVVLPGSDDRKRDVAFRVNIQRVEQVERPLQRLTLIVAACKGERMDWLVEKCTELGVDRVWIATFERSVANPGDGKLERFERLARQACKQCRRVWMPELRAEITLPTAVEEWRKKLDGSLIVAHPDGAGPSLGSTLCELHAETREVAIVVGPEGGLSDAELTGLQACGAQRVRLAKHTLRAETAAVAAASVWADSQCG